MGQETGISWTDHTFNPWWGCTEVSPGCDNCYARVFDAKVEHMKEVRTGAAPELHWGKGAPRRSFGEKHWHEPLKWDRLAERDGVQRRVFCASMADIMDDEAPFGGRERLWALINKTPNLIWQLLTKRPHRYESRYLPDKFKYRNVHLGTTAENQEFYDVRWPILRRAADARGMVAWISYEPALGPLSIAKGQTSSPDWIIFGGESGVERRPCEREWADNLLAECRSLDVKFFMKQMGGLNPQQGKALIPIELMVQEFPA